MSGGIRIIALDLDGTLLDSQKRLSPRNRAALERVAAKGVHVVPTTGRFFGMMPAAVRDLPFVRYAITINGAQVYDREADAAIADHYVITYMYRAYIQTGKVEVGTAELSEISIASIIWSILVADILFTSSLKPIT